MTQDAVNQEIAEAAEAEGLIAMPFELIALREEKRALDEELAKLEGRKKEIQDIFGKALDEAGAKGFMLYGKVHARVTMGTRQSVDVKKLREDMPHIYNQYVRLTAYKSVRVD